MHLALAHHAAILQRDAPRRCQTKGRRRQRRLAVDVAEDGTPIDADDITLDTGVPGEGVEDEGTEAGVVEAWGRGAEEIAEEEDIPGEAGDDERGEIVGLGDGGVDRSIARTTPATADQLRLCRRRSAPSAWGGQRSAPRTTMPA